MAREVKDFYRVLGVDRNATEKDIRAAYRRLARRYHPDVNPGDKEAEERFKRVSEAYAVLGDAEKRKRYDAMGPEFFRGGVDPSGWRNVRVDFEDLGGFGGFADLFSDLFGGRADTGVRRAPEKGANVEQPVDITVAESVTGATKTIRVDMEDYCEGCSGSGGRSVPCNTCSGSGRSSSRGALGMPAPCPACGGTGQVVQGQCTQCRGLGVTRRTRKLEVKIPAGVEEGAKIRLASEGQAGRYGGPRGDLLLRARLRQDPVFSRRGADVLCEVAVTFPEAALGAEVRVPTIGGSATLKIPPGTQSGQVLRMAGLGAPRLRGGGRGDQLVRVKVVVPKDLTPEQREAVEKLGGAYRGDPRAEDYGK